MMGKEGKNEGIKKMERENYRVGMGCDGRTRSGEPGKILQRWGRMGKGENGKRIGRKRRESMREKNMEEVNYGEEEVGVNLGRIGM